MYGHSIADMLSESQEKIKLFLFHDERVHFELSYLFTYLLIKNDPKNPNTKQIILEKPVISKLKPG